MEYLFANAWLSLCRALGAGGSARELLERLVECHGEAQRAYHTLEHVLHCLKWFGSVRHLAVHPDETEMALWLHDVVYDPHAGDNEARSAEWAEKSLGEAGVRSDNVQRIAALILATRHDQSPVDGDAALVVDIDLAILGEEPAVFDEYERRIRQEYAWVPQATFRAKRAELLERFLARSYIYHTPYFRERLEAQARRNLERSNRMLKQKS
jgi:predicted metal-dependent HD superfamily phosphohydrolase